MVLVLTKCTVMFLLVILDSKDSVVKQEAKEDGDLFIMVTLTVFLLKFFSLHPFITGNPTMKWINKCSNK